MSATLRRILIGIVLVLAALALVAWLLLRGDTADYTIEQLSGPRPVLAEPQAETIPTINVARIIGWGDAMPTPAQGLAVNRFADNLDHPRTILTLPNGDVLVAETNSPPRTNKGIEGMVMRFLMNQAGAGTPSANRIALLRDADGDGRAEQRSVLLSGLNSPFGMALGDGTLYVANTDAVLAFPFEPGQTRITEPGRKIADLPATAPNNHWGRGLLLSPDESQLMISVGSASNIAEHGIEVEKNRAAILVHDFAKNRTTLYAGGLRNPVGMDWNPQSGELWTVVNERDMLGSDLVPDYLASVPFGAQFGWPWLYWGDNVDDRVEAPMPDFINSYTRRPEYALGSHVAPLGLAFAREDAALGPRFARGAFIALHGSWNRKPAAGYKVVFVPFDEFGKPAVTRDAQGNITSGLPVDVLDGFLTDDGARGRPTMLAFDQTGALLVTDDVTGIVWRVSARR